MEDQAMPQDGGGEDSIGDTIVSTDKNLRMLAKAAAGAQVPDEIKAGMQQISDAFAALVEQFLGATEGAPQGPQQAEVSTPEQGGNPNARPMVG